MKALTKTTVSRAPRDSPETSACGCFNKVTNKAGFQQIKQLSSSTTLDGMAGKVFASESELNEKLIKVMNESDAAFQYKLNLTDKYIHIRCTRCALFSVWLRNVDLVDMSQFYKPNDGKKR